MRPAISCRASSQVASRNSPAPFGPVRINGVRTRSGAYTRCACRLTLAQIQSSVNGFTGDASILVMRGPSTAVVTVTANEQASGQSSVQAVCTTRVGNESVATMRWV
jgi:hypothetical protein